MQQTFSIFLLSSSNNLLNLIFRFFQLEIKSSQYTIPDDGRVSEDTKSIIRKLLIVDPSRRMTASQANF